MTVEPGFRLEGEATPFGQLRRDLWHNRDLISILTRQTFYVQYRRAVFGVLWSIVLPLIQAVVLAVVLTRVTDLGKGVGGGPHYVTFIFTGTVVWSFFSGSLTGGSTSIVTGSGLTTKVYFPRSILPLVSVFANLYSLVASTVVLLGLCLVTGTAVDLKLLMLPVVMVLAIAITSGVTLVLAALHVYFRDVRYLVTAAIQPWFYLTPIFYPVTLIGSARPWLEVNPITGIVLLYRWSTIGTHEPIARALLWTGAWTVGLFVVAALLYRRFERVFADLM